MREWFWCWCDRIEDMCSEFYRVCCDASSTIHPENVTPENGFLKEEVAVYLEEGVVDFDKKDST